MKEKVLNSYSDGVPISYYWILRKKKFPIATTMVPTSYYWSSWKQSTAPQRRWSPHLKVLLELMKVTVPLHQWQLFSHSVVVAHEKYGIFTYNHGSLIWVLELMKGKNTGTMQPQWWSLGMGDVVGSGPGDFGGNCCRANLQKRHHESSQFTYRTVAAHYSASTDTAYWALGEDPASNNNPKA